MALIKLMVFYRKKMHFDNLEDAYTQIRYMELFSIGLYFNSEKNMNSQVIYMMKMMGTNNETL